MIDAGNDVKEAFVQNTRDNDESVKHDEELERSV